MSVNIVGDLARAVTASATVSTAAAGAVGGAVLGGAIGGVRGTVGGVREGVRMGWRSLPVAAATLDAARGGFEVAGGLSLSLGIERVVSVNGAPTASRVTASWATY